MGFVLSLAGLYQGTKGQPGNRGMFALGAASLVFGLFGKGQTTEIGRLTDTKTSTAGEGEPLPLGWGEFETGGVVVWSTKLIPHTDSDSTGKGKSRIEKVQYSYTVSLLALGGEGEIDYLKAITLNGKRFYSFDGSTHSGFSMTYDPDTKTYSGSNADEESLTILLGSNLQLPHPLIEADKGIGWAPAYIGRWGVLLENLQLNPYNSNVPAIKLLAYKSRNGVPAIITDIAAKVNVPSGDLDLSDLTGKVTTGFIIPGRTSAAAPIEELMLSHQFHLPEVDGVVKGVDLLTATQNPVASLSEDEVRVTADAGNYPQATHKIGNEKAVPAIIEIASFDPDRRMDVGYSRAGRTSPTAKGKETITLHQVLTGAQRTRIAKILLKERYMGRETVELSMGFPALQYAACDSIDLLLPTGTVRLLLPGLQAGLFGPITCTAPRTDPHIYDVPLGEETGGLPQATITTYGDFSYVFIDSVAAYDALEQRPGIYFASTVPDGSGWRTVKWQSDAFGGDDGLPYFDGDLQSSPATMGNSVGALGDFSPESNIFDDENTLTVDLIRGTLSSISEATLLQGRTNRCFVGREVVGFCTATDMGMAGDRRRYQLTHLLRGMRGSENYIGTHGSAEAFVLLNNAVSFKGIDPAYLQVTAVVGFKAPDGTLATTDIVPVGRNMWPYSPAYIEGSRDGSDNLTITWKRRSKLTDTSFTTGSEPGDAPYDLREYRVQILNGSGDIVRTLDTVTTESATYTAAEQIEDFGSVQASVTVRVAQRNSVVGWGFDGTGVV